MGRYYSGDIEGKFWFAVQDSDDASNFGGDEEEILDEESDDAMGIHYTFNKEHMTSINQGLDECLNGLGEYKEKLDEFFEKHDSYNPEELAKSIEVDPIKCDELLKYYARHELGMKIKNYVEKNGSCTFDADFY